MKFIYLVNSWKKKWKKLKKFPKPIGSILPAMQMIESCYIPIFYFKLCPKFPFLFHTPMFPMFLMTSYSILRCFPQSSDIFPHSDVLPAPMFPKSSCSIPCSDVFWCFPMFSDVFPIFIDVEPFWSYYGLIIIMEPFR